MFEFGILPNIYNALIISKEYINRKKFQVCCEVQQLLGDKLIRTISINATDGLIRGIVVQNIGMPLNIPVGKITLGRIFNVMGNPVDNIGPVNIIIKLSIHRQAPIFT